MLRPIRSPATWLVVELAVVAAGAALLAPAAAWPASVGGWLLIFIVALIRERRQETAGTGACNPAEAG